MSNCNPYDIDEAYGIRQLGEIVRHARRDAGVSQHTLAALVRVDQSVISKLESGKLKGLRLRRLGAVIAVLDGRIEFWIGLRPSPTRRLILRMPPTVIDQETSFRQRHAQAATAALATIVERRGRNPAD